MKKPILVSFVLAAAAVHLSTAHAQEPKGAAKKPAVKTSGDPERGKYLVTVGGCHDCHTPLKMTPNGPAPDMSRALSGHPQEIKMTAVPELPEGPWGVVVAHTLTAWAGPWGVSFTRNLTPDKETGIGNWTERTFMETIRNGKHLGRGRPLLPPMPWFNYAEMTDHDLKSVYAYLMTLPPIRNEVPEPLPPPAPKAGSKK